MEITQVLKISYDGTNYFGWQKQPQVITIQSAIEAALAKLYGCEIKTTGASRTDAGVHALDQKVSYVFEKRYEPWIVKKALNAFLPKDIAVDEVLYIDAKFSARFDCCGKRYSYKILGQRNAFERNFSWQMTNLTRFDQDILVELANYIRGEHDFGAFGIKSSLPESTICVIFDSQWQFYKNALMFSIEGNRFLHKMIRNLVGAQLACASQKFTLHCFMHMLQTGVRNVEFPTAPPNGLVLEQTFYKNSNLLI